MNDFPVSSFQHITGKGLEEVFLKAEGVGNSVGNIQLMRTRAISQQPLRVGTEGRLLLSSQLSSDMTAPASTGAENAHKAGAPQVASHA
ncbi:hypothetical protein BaRGS_00017242 [Batillaria attramentaria]|uniref:Uncharacterized protein n=1 Tax=Batillaria attramentaria TaxID=370345 RepID=A0ABD0KW78_9CAEN